MPKKLSGYQYRKLKKKKLENEQKVLKKVRQINQVFKLFTGGNDSSPSGDLKNERDTSLYNMSLVSFCKIKHIFHFEENKFIFQPGGTFFLLKPSLTLSLLDFPTLYELKFPKCNLDKLTTL